MRTFNSSKFKFNYPSSWEVEKADILSNPDCIATLSKGESNLINAVMFPTNKNLDEFKIFMENSISDDGGVILSSDFTALGKRDIIKLHANMDTPDINFDIHTVVFIENAVIFIFELRTLDITGVSEKEFLEMVESFKLK